MRYAIQDINLFDAFCSDTSADNCYDYADGARPVYLDADGDGAPVLTTDGDHTERPYGYLYTLFDSDDAERTVVVRC